MAIYVNGLSAEPTITSSPAVESGAENEVVVEQLWESSTSTARTWGIFLLLVALVAAAGASVWWLTPEPLPVYTRAALPQPVFVNERLALITPGYVLTAELAAYNDELFAYLMFDYLRHSPVLPKTGVLLSFDPTEARQYRLILRGAFSIL